MIEILGILLWMALVVYVFAFPFVVARAAYRRRGPVAGIAAGVAAIAGWALQPALTFPVSFVVLILLRCFPHKAPEPEPVPRATVV